MACNGLAPRPGVVAESQEGPSAAGLPPEEGGAPPCAGLPSPERWSWGEGLVGRLTVKISRVLSARLRRGAVGARVS